jgi:RHH-type proline utilization regulon transcriptional repressor/proline dehydrogenase/delta 1-pyrroline-5-carboxylate dehydrogenase
MEEWVSGDPARLQSDMGPVIDVEARDMLQSHIDAMARTRTVLSRGRPPDADLDGYFVPPTIIEIEAIADLTGEVFGPVLHVLRYRAADLARLIDDINELGYGLTLGVQSRIEQRAEDIRDRVRVGNVYVNRNMIGAVAGVQPFGGCGLSGTGPKAGGPHYLLRFATEQTYTVNTAAIGGNASLLSEDPMAGREP